MIKETTFQFLKDLGDNNNKIWMDENRERFIDAKNNVVEFARTLIADFSEIDPTIAALDASKCLTRLNRDMRFAKKRNLPPYKNDYFLVLNKKRLHGITAGYFLHIQPGNMNCFIGGGVWNPLREELTQFRKEIAYFYDDFKKIIDDQDFKNKFPSGIQGDGALVKVPREFDPEDPAAEFLKMKGFCTKENIAQKDLIGKNAIKNVISYFERSKPLVDFLNKGLDAE